VNTKSMMNYRSQYKLPAVCTVD